MATIIGPWQSDFWASHPIEAFHGAPLHLGCWMSRNHFDTILQVLSFTDLDPPNYVDKFWEVQQMLKAWGSNMVSCFMPGWANCLDESMSIWTKKFSCPGFMYIPRKPWPFGNEYHMVCCCATGMMWGIDLVEGKDHLHQMGQQKYDDLGATVGLLLQLFAPIFFKGFIFILDSGFCVLKGIIELCKKGVFASALIKKRRYWPKFIRGEEIKENFADKDVGDADSWGGVLDDKPLHVYAMKEPNYVMSLMSTYGTNDCNNGKETRRDWKENGENKRKPSQYL